MKNFLEHLKESQKTYEFRIKLANVDPAQCEDRLKTALDAYGLQTLSSAKRLPIKDNDIDFPSMKNCQLYLLDAVLTYPVNDAQLRSIISDRAGIPASQVVVVPTSHPEEIWRWGLEGNEIRQFKKGEAILDKPLEEIKNEEASKQYASAGSLLKELSKSNWEISGTDAANGKTTNELPTGDISPVGSK